MTWTQVGAIQLSRDWQYTEPIAEGSYFRLKHTEAPNGGLFAIAQCEVDSEGNLSIGDSQILAVEKGIADIVKLPKSAYTNRRIAIKKVTSLPSLEQEIRRLFLPNFLMPLEQEINYIRRNNWRVDIEVSDYAEIVGTDYTERFNLIDTKLTTIEQKISSTASSSSSSAGQTNQGTQLTYASNGDENGVFYYLGSNGKTATWSNPHVSGNILLSLSSFGEGDLAGIVDRSGNTVATANEANPWIKVDLKTKSLKCNYYSLKGWQYGVARPRAWNLQGSNDDSNWTTLDTQSNNPVPTNDWFSQSISSDVAYKYFRILQTGTNTSGETYLSLGEWELYGNLI